MKQRIVKHAVKPSSSSEVNHEEIARRAYEIYLKRGAVPGRELDDWVQAEQEFRSQEGRTANSRSGGEVVIQPSGGFGPDVSITKS
jgi:hypothetical protein